MCLVGGGGAWGSTKFEHCSNFLIWYLVLTVVSFFVSGTLFLPGTIKDWKNIPIGYELITLYDRCVLPHTTKKHIWTMHNNLSLIITSCSWDLISNKHTSCKMWNISKTNKKHRLHNWFLHIYVAKFCRYSYSNCIS